MKILRNTSAFFGLASVKGVVARVAYTWPLRHGAGVPGGIKVGARTGRRARHRGARISSGGGGNAQVLGRSFCRAVRPRTVFPNIPLPPTSRVRLPFRVHPQPTHPPPTLLAIPHRSVETRIYIYPRVTPIFFSSFS